MNEERNEIENDFSRANKYKYIYWNNFYSIDFRYFAIISI